MSLYSSANIWLVGHSLGGALTSLLAASFGLPFEFPGERLGALCMIIKFMARKAVTTSTSKLGVHEAESTQNIRRE
jgi:putative lipase involved disintegration of autophagic bodies